MPSEEGNNIPGGKRSQKSEAKQEAPQKGRFLFRFST